MLRVKSAVFTGIVTHIGTVVSAQDLDGGRRIGIRTMLPEERRTIGASVACSGCCLTVVQGTEDTFFVEVSGETLSKTHLGLWKEGTRINLEPSLRLGDELGGHFVFGHVDGLAELEDVRRDGASVRMTIRPPVVLLPLVASKGSVALDGVSLTVNEVGEDGTFGVNIIPHTWTETTFSDRIAGDRLHIEADMLARYVQRIQAFG